MADVLLQSTDNGVTWSGPQELVPGDVSGGRGPVRNKPLRLASGRILAGASTEHGIWKPLPISAMMMAQAGINPLLYRLMACNIRQVKKLPTVILL